MQELARTYTPAAIKALGDALNSPRERVAAAAVLLDRAWGKPLQSVAVSGDTDAIGLHLLAARAAQLLEGTGPPAPPTLEGHADSEPGPGPNLLDAPKPVE
jgi:hypothetical protein